MPPAGFEPVIPAGDRPQTLALDRSVTGTGAHVRTKINVLKNFKRGNMENRKLLVFITWITDTFLNNLVRLSGRHV
jgi:hypothetical protein